MLARRWNTGPSSWKNFLCCLAQIANHEVSVDWLAASTRGRKNPRHRNKSSVSLVSRLLGFFFAVLPLSGVFFILLLLSSSLRPSSTCFYLLSEFFSGVTFFKFFGAFDQGFLPRSSSSPPSTSAFLQCLLLLRLRPAPSSGIFFFRAFDQHALLPCYG